MRVPVVYTMGKVASSSVAGAIVRAGLRCHDIHTLNTQLLLKQARDRLDRGQYPPNHVCVTMAWQNEIRNARRCIYVSMVRDPIARNLSAYFQKLHVGGDSLNAAEASVAAFRATYPHLLPIHWFDKEFKRFLGIDIYDIPFDKARRFAVTERFLLMRTDLDDAEKSRLLSAALGAKIDVERENDSARKPYSSIYQSVLESTKFPAAFVEAMYSTKFARHFWTDEELAEFRERWTEASGKTFARIDRPFPDRADRMPPLPATARS